MPTRPLRLGPLPPPDVAEFFRHTLSAEDIRGMNLFFGLRATCQLVENTIQSWIEPDALSPGRIRVLMVLLAAGRPVAQKHIVAALKVSRPNVRKPGAKRAAPTRRKPKASAARSSFLKKRTKKLLSVGVRPPTSDCPSPFR